jgi:hypothetical protein
MMCLYNIHIYLITRELINPISEDDDKICEKPMVKVFLQSSGRQPVVREKIWMGRRKI